MAVCRFSVAITAALSLAMAAPAIAAKLFRGPVEARTVEIIDGDTFLAEALVWPGHSVRVNIRIRGIDAPEMKAKCDAERTAAIRARDGLSQLLAGQLISLSNIAGAKYYGRVLADVTTADGNAVAQALLGEKLVRPYRGGRREGWCG